MSTHARKNHAVVAAIVLTLLAMVTAACGDKGGSAAPAPRKHSPSPSRTPSASPSKTAATPALPPGVSPFTGQKVGATRPVLAVKIDNVRQARPATGLAKADLIYVEQVEAGLARILAVFSSHLPGTVGPVRSARESDLELLREFGTPAFAYSGANSRVLPLIHKARLHDVSPARAGSTYFRGSSRPAPHNLYAKPSGLLAHAPKTSKAHDIGFRFGAAPPGGRPTGAVTVKYPAFRATFRWSPGTHRWLVSMDGAAVRATNGVPPKPSTVVVQYVKIHPSRFGDKWGNITPYTQSVGSGKARVLRDGRAYDVRWSRPKPDAGTTFATASGKRMTFAPGQVWVVFAKA
ncbi:MAG TPA: DUF3048 domain-containing protein [Actinopolymorphaceae bacterium]|nr:DUF3048 domain-containing protein [Actinopolymorphaceae bacterium]